MPLDLVALRVAAHDPLRLARFWAGVLGREVVDDRGRGVELPPGDDTGISLRFHPTKAWKVGQNRVHLDLTSSSLEDQQATVARALALGGRPVDVGQGPEELHVVLADPEGNEFCVIEPGNRFLAGCGVLGAVNCDGTRALGQFWSRALGWPMVWDQDEETAIQSPRGGPKITWSGPPLMPRLGEERFRLEVVPAAGGDPQAEVERLVALGATRREGRESEGGRTVLADPDGNDLVVLAAR